ncbi:MAG TPA: DUF1028 domain-containing protein [Alphaproteobacteria bacterium]|nr:DUF1028 domain-containing protein [Alphaproteobacteria bacterium]
MTFSIVGRCARSGAVGMAISSSSIAVASRCVWVRVSAGAVASQNVTDPVLGIRLLDLLEEGVPAGEALARITAAAPHIVHRQLAVVDREGRVAHYTGAKALGVTGAAAGRDCVAAGNLLANSGVPAAMAEAFAAAPEAHLAERLLRALERGLAAGGEAGPVHSAGLVVAHEQPWPVVNLRVDWADEAPIAALRKTWDLYEPQMKDYIQRALDPTAAPSYGVPGDP